MCDGDNMVLQMMWRGLDMFPMLFPDVTDPDVKQNGSKRMP